MGKIISFIIQKGGCGKTTTTVNIGGFLTKHRYKTLLIDMDPQGNMTQHLGIIPEAQKYTIRNVLKKEIPIQSAILHRNDFCDVIPNNILTSADEMSFMSAYGREFLLRDQLVKVMNEYDYILIDCPPSLGILSLNALVASHEIVIVIAPDFFPLMAIKPLYESIKIVKENFNKVLKIKGVAVTLCDMRTNHSKHVLEYIFKNFSNKIFYSFVRQNVSLKDASAEGKTIFEYDPASAGAEDYELLGFEFIANHLRFQQDLLNFEKIKKKWTSLEKAKIIGKIEEKMNPFILQQILNEDNSRLIAYRNICEYYFSMSAEEGLKYE